LDGVVFNTHARYPFGLSKDEDRGWLIDRIMQTVLWNEGATVRQELGQVFIGHKPTTGQPADA